MPRYDQNVDGRRLVKSALILLARAGMSSEQGGSAILDSIASNLEIETDASSGMPLTSERPNPSRVDEDLVSNLAGGSAAPTTATLAAAVTRTGTEGGDSQTIDRANIGRADGVVHVQSGRM